MSDSKSRDDLVGKNLNSRYDHRTRTLDLSQLSIKVIKEMWFERYKNIKSLDISNNNLTDFPRTLELPELEELDCSNNNFDTVEFLSLFPKLKVLFLRGNEDIRTSDRYIAASMCPRLAEVDNVSVKSFMTPYAASRVQIMKQSMKKSAEEINNECGSEECTNRRRKIVPKDFSDYTVEPTTKIKSVATKSECKKLEENSPKSSDRNMVNVRVIPLTDVIKKRKRSSLDSMKLPPVSDYKPAHFIRCHSYKNDPSDGETKVWCCSFEPDPLDNSKTTGVLATGGGKIICLIDCGTGKVLKRYKDSSPCEIFFTLAWTTIASEQKSDHLNILAAAGNDKVIKLMHPSQLVLYATLTGHTRYISCLLFHPSNPRHLLSGDDDSKIFLWDIGQPNLENYSTNYSILRVFRTPRAGVTGLAYCQLNKCLVASTEYGLYVWTDGDCKKNAKQRLPNYQLVIEDQEDRMFIDGLTLIRPDIVAFKCSQSDHMTMFKLSKTIQQQVPVSSGLSRVTITNFARLDYSHITTDYINISSCNGQILSAGDDAGCIHLYNLDSVLNKKTVPNTILHQSAVLRSPQMFSSPKCAMSDIDSAKAVLPSFVINTTTMSPDGRYLVGGTDNNLVCIWKKV